MSRKRHRGWANTRGGHVPKGKPMPAARPNHGPKLAIQCFEGRHTECSGEDTLLGGKCGCTCHLQPLSPHAWEELADLARRGAGPSSKINPGVLDRFQREHLIRFVMMSSPFPTHKGRHIQHALITDAGLAKLKERP